MLIIRPIRASDYDSLYQIAIESGHGFTSLPVNEELLKTKIARTESSFNRVVEQPFNEGYLLVLEDMQTGKVVGTAGIEAAVGMIDVFYHYRLGTEVYHSEQIGVRNEVETLTLCHDHTGAAELCTLFINKDYRKHHYGRVLSRSRFLLLAQYPERFGQTVIAEMRGKNNTEGESPFYDWLQQHFLGIEFVEADYLSGLGKKLFMAELMPKNAIYVCLLPPAAQKVIGEVHRNTKPALSLLEREGFRYRGYVDIFDAGPTVECDLQDIHSVKHSRLVTVVIGDGAYRGTQYIIANTKLADFRATVVALNIIEDDKVVLSAEIAQNLLVSEGEQIRIIAL